MLLMMTTRGGGAAGLLLPPSLSLVILSSWLSRVFYLCCVLWGWVSACPRAIFRGREPLEIVGVGRLSSSSFFR